MWICTPSSSPSRSFVNASAREYGKVYERAKEMRGVNVVPSEKVLA